MKFEWRKHEKALYGAKSIPALVDIPTQNDKRLWKGIGLRYLVLSACMCRDSRQQAYQVFT